MRIRTDIHCHFAGTLSADELIDIAIENNVNIDLETVKKN
jgi:hypothetical protein